MKQKSKRKKESEELIKAWMAMAKKLGARRVTRRELRDLLKTPG